MLLGLNRQRTRFGGANPRPFDRAMRPFDPARQWAAERGEILFEASCDVAGGFPGFGERGGSLDDTRLRVSERFLIAGDGDDRGFGLPIGEIEGVAFVSGLEREDFGLRVFYRDGNSSPRLFTILFHGNRLALRSGPRAVRAHLSLLRAGLADRFAGSPPPEPNFVVPWDRTADIETENVLWTGSAFAPRQVGLEGVVSNVWLTTRSLIWGNAAMEGVHRVPLSLVTDVAAAAVVDRAGTPAVYVGLGDETIGHFDLAFLFDQQSTPDHNLRDRGAFLVGLRSRGIPVGAPTTPIQPWRHELGLVPDQQDAMTFDEGPNLGPAEPAVPIPLRPARPRRRLGTFDFSAEEAITPGADESRVAAGGRAVAGADLVLAEWASLPEDEGAIGDDVQVSAGWSWREAWHFGRQAREADSQDLPETTGDDDERTAATADEAGHDEPQADTILASAGGTADDAAEERPTDAARFETTWPQASAYESNVVGALADVLAAIRDRVSGKAVAPIRIQIPAPLDQQAAIAELAALGRAGAIAPDELRARSARLVALGDACVRLRTLIELRDAGHVSDADLARRQRAITGQLASLMDVR